jgi:hypothetical protein
MSSFVWGKTRCDSGMAMLQLVALKKVQCYRLSRCDRNAVRLCFAKPSAEQTLGELDNLGQKMSGMTVIR